MDWQIKTLSKNSSQSGAVFKAGDAVVCVIFLNASGEFERADFLKSEFTENSFGGTFIGKWERIVSENPEADERLARKMALAGAEDFFISLFDETGAKIEQRENLKYLLALHLERKRILRAKGRPQNNIQLYIHVQSKREFSVEQKDLTQELISNIQSQIDVFTM